MQELDLETLKYLKKVFEYYSDSSPKCLGYNYIVSKIKEIEG